MSDYQKPNLAHHLRHSPAHKTKTAKTLKIVSAFAAFAAIVALGLFVYFGIYKPIVKNADAARQKAAELVQGGTQAPSYQTVASAFGYSLTYNTQTFSAEGQVTSPQSSGEHVYGQSYAGKDLSTEREYSMIRLSLPSIKTGAYVVEQPQMTVLTNIRKDYFSSKETLPANKGKSDLDILVATIGADEVANGFVAGTSNDVVINGTTYRQVVYTLTDKSFSIPTTTTDIHYYTVQNGRPYTIEITGIRSSSQEAVSLYRSVMRTITFSSPDTSKLSAKGNALASKTVPLASLPSDSVNIPNALDPDTILKVVARNQPSVVRIGAGECADITLLLPSGGVGAVLHSACNAGIGSGSFVSRDGYIATNGHVALVGTANMIVGYVALAPSQTEAQQRLDTVLGYLVDSGIMSTNEVNAMIAGVKAQDQNAIAKLDAIGGIIPDNLIKVAHDRTTYAVQTSDAPMHITVTAGGLQWNYSKTILAATYVDSDIDPQVLKTGMSVTGSPHTDVAILKAKGAFPSVQLGSSDRLKAGDELTAIGYPAFVDGGLDTTKLRTIPSITQGVIEGIDIESTHRLFVTTVPIGHGNSGGPAFDSTGKQVALNTYGNITCPDQNCFGSGTARDIADFTSLLAKNHISLASHSAISDNWNAGIDAYIAGDYQTAQSKFADVVREYPASYLASEFAALTVSQVGTASDTSSAVTARNTSGSLAIWLGAVAVAALLILGTYLVYVSKRHHKMLAAQEMQQPAVQQSSQPPSNDGQPPVPPAQPPTA